MRKTGSRDPRESLEASVTSPFSIAVNTFSIRLGSRRNQRPVHQKIRSITTVSPMIDTIKIGHMIGPPLWNLSINQLLPKRPGSAAGEAAGASLGAAAVSARANRHEQTAVPGASTGRIDLHHHFAPPAWVTAVRGRPLLQPANTTMSPMRYQERDVLIQGVVVGIIRKY